MVFSGGKAERRKGQDIVIAAFAKFARHHPDALLVTAWHSPWPWLARTLDIGGLAAHVTFTAQDQLDVAAWAQANGIAADQVLNLGAVPNAAMPDVLRDVDLAVFPNRGEGGTNLVAMEAMACGAPTVLSGNTGHLDLIEDGNCYVLTRQSPIADEPGWGESDVEELVAAMEVAYLDREDARRRGGLGAQTLAGLTWARTAAAMRDIVLAPN